MSDNMPDFDNMSPEEIMAWMETLAKRQGASEGFTTAADMDIAEIDPNSVVIDEPGYVPYGQESTQPIQKQPSAPSPIKPPEPARSPVTPLRPAFQPEALTPQVRPLSPVQPARPPAPPPLPPEPPKPAPVEDAPPVGESALAWLESLAADQGEDLFNLDLTDLPTQMGESVAAPAAPVNPMTWLEDLARSQTSEPSLEPLVATDDDMEESEKLDPFAEGVNPMEWLETLAKRQGAKEEELTTRASMNIPAPPDTEVEEDDYQPFSFDTPPTRRSPEPAALENPADWLNSIAGAAGYSEEGVRTTQPAAEAAQPGDVMSLAEIESAIADGTVTREQMQYFLDQQASQLAQEPDEVYDEVDEDEGGLVPAELPDWLSQLMPQAPAPAAEPTKPIDALFEQPTAVEMPDWLTGGTSDAQADDLESIFEPDDEESRPYQPVMEVDIPTPDPNDRWVEAFDDEYEQGSRDVATDVPEWYEQNVNDPERIAAVDSAYEASAALESAVLPEENSLPAGQPQPLPSWMSGYTPEEAAEPEPEAASEANVFEEMPDWLKEVEASVSPEEVPDWLVETIGMSEQAEEAEAVVETPPEPVYVAPPAPVRQVSPPPAPVRQAPPSAPAPARIPVGEAAAVLERARDREQSGDLEGALTEYVSMIRSGAALDSVVDDLSLLVKSYKTVPAVYRVLGDGLMRQGKLQAALNTYREALNQL